MDPHDGIAVSNLSRYGSPILATASKSVAKHMTDTIIDRNPNILGGTPVFAGTRVPIRILFDHLEAGDRLADFLDSYPTVSHAQAVGLLEQANEALVGTQNEAVA